MITPPPTCRSRLARPFGVLALIAAGLGIGFGWGPARDGLARPWDDAPRPAVRFAPPEKLEPNTVTARAAPFDYLNTPPASPKPPTTSTSTIPSDWQTPRPTPKGPVTPPTSTTGPLNWLSSQAKSLSKSITGSGDTQPEPRVGKLPVPPKAASAAPAPPPSRTIPTPQFNQPATTGAPLAGTAPNGAPVVAGTPAYRWWGWGATTPGANPYAPNGVYPQGSTNWYAQTGATPGAFPVPMTNAFRAPPGANPPAYTAGNLPQPTMAPPTPQPSNRVPLATSVNNGTASVGPTPTLPPPDVRWEPSVATPPPVMTPPVRVVDPGWSPAPSLPVPPPTLIRGQRPDDSPAELVRAACQNLVTDVAVETLPGKRLVVHFTTTTATLAEMAARAVSGVPELKPFAVTFDAKLTAR